MKIRQARAVAKLIALLYRLKILSAEQCDRLIDDLTVKSLRAELLKRHPKDTLTEDFNGEPGSKTK